MIGLPVLSRKQLTTLSKGEGLGTSKLLIHLSDKCYAFSLTALSTEGGFLPWKQFVHSLKREKKSVCAVCTILKIKIGENVNLQKTDGMV